MMIKRLRGVQDILPPQIYRWQWIEEQAREIFGLFGFSEIRLPIIERTELFQRSIGEYTDIVSKEMYTFKDRGGRNITLRPEGTASVIRAYIEGRLLPPQRFYYMGPMFRYEKPQAGRQRQFYQMGVEIIGEASAHADAEIIFMLDTLFKRLGLKDFRFKINSVGCPNCRKKYEDALREHFRDRIKSMCSDCQVRYEHNVFRILDCKNEICQSHIEAAPPIYEFLCDDCRQHYDEFKRLLRDGGVEFYEDPRLVRGLDYYTQTAFEVVGSGLGAQDALAAGGRYNNLVKELGGADTPAVGMAIGMERLVMAVENAQLAFPQRQPLALLFASSALKAKSFELLLELREQGLSVISFFDKNSLKSQLKIVNRLGIRVALILGEEEFAKGGITLRDMDTGEQVFVPKAKIKEEVERRLTNDLQNA